VPTFNAPEAFPGSRRAARTAIPLPPDMTDAVRRLLAGEATPAVPRHASTVILLRDGHAGLDVYLMRRAGSMAFAGGFHAFPGGGVSVGDMDSSIGWRGPAPAWWAARIGCDEDVARALVCAAVRETYEESGVLLAAGVESSEISRSDHERVELAAHELSLAELLDRHGLRVASDVIAPWARWLTPEFEKRRYDTVFFVAALPDGQSPADVSGEADQAGWWPVAEALARFEAGEIRMLPPTVTNLRDLAGFADVGAVIAEASTRTLATVMPRARLADDGRYLLEW
jgi:8-oxo-dGTP pyrophosphatase MutT (NUDIX family)